MTGFCGKHMYDTMARDTEGCTRDFLHLHRVRKTFLFPGSSWIVLPAASGVAWLCSPRQPTKVLGRVLDADARSNLGIVPGYCLFARD